MKNKQRLVTALVTIVAATATAHLMQRNSSAEARIGAPPPVQAALVVPLAVPSASVVSNELPVERPSRPAAPTVARINPAPADVEPAETTPVAASDPAAEGAPEPPVPDRVLLAAATEPVTPAPDQSLQAVPDMPRPPVDALTPTPLPSTGADLADRMAGTDRPDSASAESTGGPRRNEFGLTCGVILSASERPGAMVNLTLTAPCRGEEVITVRHGGLQFSGRMSHLGSYSALVPALAQDAEFTVAFPDGEVSTTQLTVSAANDVERVVLQTRGETGLQIHALEFGADYDMPGHVWAGQPRDAGSAIKTGGGFITQMGDPALDEAHLAEVYTFPADARIRDGVVRLSIEAEVTAYNCAKDIAGQTMQRQADGGMKSVTVTLAMPDCEAIGEFLVLKNLLQDLKIASN
ncbi:MAG: hypothetical protein QNJ44_09330 [Rhodobacter sp.]|nr:hypothetical protein [Rhodobacter sp.]